MFNAIIFKQVRSSLESSFQILGKLKSTADEIALMDRQTRDLRARRSSLRLLHHDAPSPMAGHERSASFSLSLRTVSQSQPPPPRAAPAPAPPVPRCSPTHGSSALPLSPLPLPLTPLPPPLSPLPPPLSTLPASPSPTSPAAMPTPSVNYALSPPLSPSATSASSAAGIGLVLVPVHVRGPTARDR